jgi:hypothetical protein
MGTDLPVANTWNKQASTMTTVLRSIVKSYATTLRVRTGQPLRRECWEAVTIDGEWAFERIEEPGTPWIVVHHPRTPEAETAHASFGTLRAARSAVERGLNNWLPSVQRAVHDRGEHETAASPYGCRACNERRWAR